MKILQGILLFQAVSVTLADIYFPFKFQKFTFDDWFHPLNNCLCSSVYINKVQWLLLCYYDLFPLLLWLLFLFLWIKIYLLYLFFKLQIKKEASTFANLHLLGSTKLYKKLGAFNAFVQSFSTGYDDYIRQL